MGGMSNAELIAMISKKTIEMDPRDKSALEFITENGGFSDALLQQKEAKEERDAKIVETERLRVEAKDLSDNLGVNQFLLTDMTEGRLPSSGLQHVMFKYPRDQWTEEHHCNIPEVDVDFYWDADTLEAIWLAYVTNQNCLAVGPPGTGKTAAGHQLCAWIRQPYARFNGKDGIEPASILGYPWALKDGMVWMDGILTQAVTSGYYMAIDEIFKLSPGIQMAMQSLYEEGGYLMLDEKPGTVTEKRVEKRVEFRILGTDNTKGTGDDLDKYAAGQMQDTSSLDRFGITIEMGYLKPKVEQGILYKMFPSVDKKAINKSVAMANLVRTSFIKNGDLSLTMSLRGLRVTCKLLERGLSLIAALDLSYINKLGEDSEVQTARKFTTDCI